MTPEEKKAKGLGIDTKRIRETLLNFVVPLVAFGITLGLFIIVIYPSYKKLPELKTELTTKSNLKLSLNTKLQRLNRLVDFKPVVEEDSALVDRVLVSEEEVPRLLDQVNQIATDAGMSITRLSYSYGSSGTSDKTEKKAFSSVSVSLGADANYDQIILLMKSVEKAARFVSIPNFRYSAGTSSVGDKLLNASFSLDSPYLFVKSTAVTDEPIDLDIASQKFIDFINMIKELKYYEFINPNIEVVKEEPVAATATTTETTPATGAQTTGSVPATE
jgi:Tfp pilus assembly protein PilO